MDEKFSQGEDSVGMTDFQFTEYQKVCAECETLREANRTLQRNAPVCDDGMTDFQYKNIIEMIYQILKANFDAGKTPKEILSVITALKTS